jgi:Ca-activated chloride channel family protein
MGVSDLADRSLWEKDRDRLVQDIRELSLSYGSMSRYTAFLAVDSSSTTAGDHGVTVTQPAPVPAGVRYETTVGGSS